MLVCYCAFSDLKHITQCEALIEWVGRLCQSTCCNIPSSVPTNAFQAARSGLEKCQQKAASASADADKAEALVGVETYEALVKALE